MVRRRQRRRPRATSPRPCANTARPPTRCWSGDATFEAFRSFWPQQTDDETGVHEHLNRVHKYVVSSTLTEPGWEPSDGPGPRRHRAAEGRRGPRHRVHRQPHAGARVDRARARRRVPAVRLSRRPRHAGSGCSSEAVNVELAETRTFRSGDRAAALPRVEHLGHVGAAGLVVLEQHPALLVAAAVDHGRQEVAPDGARAAQEPAALRVLLAARRPRGRRGPGRSGRCVRRAGDPRCQVCESHAMCSEPARSTARTAAAGS